MDRIARDIGLTGVPQRGHRFDAMVRKGALDHRPVRDRADDIGVGSVRDVEGDRNVASRAESGSEKPAEPSERTGEQNAHHKSSDVPSSSVFAG